MFYRILIFSKLVKPIYFLNSLRHTIANQKKAAKKPLLINTF